MIPPTPADQQIVQRFPKLKAITNQSDPHRVDELVIGPLCQPPQDWDQTLVPVIKAEGAFSRDLEVGHRWRRLGKALVILRLRVFGPGNTTCQSTPTRCHFLPNVAGRIPVRNRLSALARDLRGHV